MCNKGKYSMLTLFRTNPYRHRRRVMTENEAPFSYDKIRAILLYCFLDLGVKEMVSDVTLIMAALSRIAPEFPELFSGTRFVPSPTFPRSEKVASALQHSYEWGLFTHAPSYRIYTLDQRLAQRTIGRLSLEEIASCRKAASRFYAELSQLG